ncbi:MAG: 2-oxo acid dehydrogenase subunit E2 [Acidimicrobiia bacterium]
MRFGRRRKKKEQQRAAWDAVAATLEAPPPVSVDDRPVAQPPAVAPPAPPAAASPAATGDEAFAPVDLPLGDLAPVTPEPPTPAAPEAVDPVTPAAPTPAPPAADVPAAPPVEPPTASGPPVFRFTPTGTVDVPTPAAPAPPVAPVPPLTMVPDPEPPSPTGLATAPPLAPTEPVAPTPPTTVTPGDPSASDPDEPMPVPPRPAPEPHATLPVVVAPPSHLAPPAGTSSFPLPAPTGRIATIPHSTRAVAERMRHALDEMVQLSMHMDAWMDQAVEMRTQLLSEWDDDTLRPSYTDFVVRAVARALVQHPELNAIVRGDSIELLPRVHVGITMPGRDGIDIPVIHDADRRNLKTIAAASLGIDTALVHPRSLPGPSAASTGGVAWTAPDDHTPAPAEGASGPGATALDTDVPTDAPASFVVASLGVYGVDAFTPVVMSPNVATLAIGRVRDATRWEGDSPTRASAMTLTLAWDHRAVDGTTAAEFLAEVRDILEQPYCLLVD